MAYRSISAVSPWRLRPLTIPPKSVNDWARLVVWGLWIGSLTCALLWAGGALIATAPDRIITVDDLSGCYANKPVVWPCERVVYQTGAMQAAFSALSGVFMILAALWLLFELWDAVAPPPITDDFLRLLSDSFARNWRDPRTWPWSRLVWAYGFAVIGATVTGSIGLALWMLLTPTPPARDPVIRIDTSQDYRLGP